MKIVVPFTILIMVFLSACGESTDATVDSKDGMSFCDCADFDGEYENETDEKFCEEKMSTWKDKLKNGDEATQQEAMDEMKACSE
jgi:hypothetical protein